MTDLDPLKWDAAAAAVALVEPGMVVGLGTGSTATHAIELLGRRYRDGLRFTGVPTSEASADLARSFGIPVITSPTEAKIDLTIDGADEIGQDDLALIKGMGGALLREKIVAVCSECLVIVADATKLKPRLSGDIAVPVEVVPFGWELTQGRLRELGCQPALRRGQNGEPFRTDGGNFILNCKFDSLPDPASIEHRLAMVVGVVETGLFIGLASTVFVASRTGIQTLGSAAPSPRVGGGDDRAIPRQSQG